MTPSHYPVRVPARQTADYVAAILCAHGATPASAQTVADHLAEADSMGLHSHGCMRVPQYIADIAAGNIDPGATPVRQEPMPTTVLVDGRLCFGQVVGRFMAETAIGTARQYGTAFVTGNHMGHTGRIGAFAEQIAQSGLIGMAFCSGPPDGHWVAPFGGREGRIATNPIAFALPRTGHAQLASDFSTSVAPEGVIRNLMNRGKPAPDGALRDADGNLTQDTRALYGPPRGALQPMGGAIGYRGTALALLTEALATLAAGDLADDEARSGSNLAIVAIHPSAGFGDRVDGMANYVTSSAPLDRDHPVQAPGDREQAARAGNGDTIEIDGTSWARIVELGGRGGAPDPL